MTTSMPLAASCAYCSGVMTKLAPVMLSLVPVPRMRRAVAAQSTAKAVPAAFVVVICSTEIRATHAGLACSPAVSTVSVPLRPSMLVKPVRRSLETTNVSLPEAE